MDKLVRQVVFGAVLLLAVLSLAGPLAAQPLPTPGQFVRLLDLRCYDIPDQPPLGVPLVLTHLNPVFINAGARSMLLQGERQKFLGEEWPRIHATIQRLGLTPQELLDAAGGDSSAAGKER